MAKTDFKYRGKTLQELNSMTIEEFAEIAGSRAKRSLQRGFDKKLLKKIKEAKQKENSKPIKTHKRDTIIIPSMIGLTFAVYTGKEFQRIDIKEKMIGHFIGEVALTRTKLRHGKAGIGATRSSTAITAK